MRPLIVGLLFGLVMVVRVDAKACQPVVLGAALSLTGKYATNGALAKKGYDFAAARINNNGGIALSDGNCVTVEVKYYDDESRGDRAATLTERLILQDQVAFMLGPYSSALTSAIAPITEKYKVPMVEGLGASRSLFNKGRKYLFAVIQTSEKTLSPVVDLAADLAVKAGRDPASVKLAIVVENDPYSLDVRAGILDAASVHGMRPIIDDQFPRDLNDLSATLTKVQLLKPDVLLVSGHSKGAVTATRQLAEKNISVPLVAMTQCESADIVGKFGADANGIICSAQWAETLIYQGGLFGSVAEFARDFRVTHPEFNGNELPYQIASASAALLVLADAIGRAESLDREAVRLALRETDLETFYGRLKFGPTGNNVAKTVFLRQIQNGKYTIVAPERHSETPLLWPRP